MLIWYRYARAVLCLYHKVLVSKTGCISTNVEWTHNQAVGTPAVFHYFSCLCHRGN